MRKKLVIVAAFTIAQASGSVAKDRAPLPPPPEIPSNWRETATMLIKQSVRDAETVRIEFREEPYLMTCKKGVFKNPEPIQIQMVNVHVNGQNGFGGYTGFMPWSVAFTPTATISYTKADGGALTRFGLCRKS